MYIRQYTSPNENFEYGYTNSNALLQFRLKFERCKPCNTAHHPTKYDVINDVKLFPAVYCRIYCRKFLTLSNQKSRYKSKGIRIEIIFLLIDLNMCLGAQKNRLIETVLFEYPQHMFWLKNKKINFPLHTLIWPRETVSIISLTSSYLHL